ncbi:uncharacterized protein LOC113237870 [Hyposmocoma kahamanoa]|uniref:uncharacterized protein LOC113237870 n=1 Tax=Hyposmocoma kahamanoa TaxID=1477025 RepID=UPI000E6D7696|nr:uncharacterized protein LOC113237870 [Hyposmocoma kahamanoa]
MPYRRIVEYFPHSVQPESGALKLTMKPTKRIQKQLGKQVAFYAYEWSNRRALVDAGPVVYIPDIEWTRVWDLPNATSTATSYTTSTTTSDTNLTTAFISLKTTFNTTSKTTSDTTSTTIFDKTSTTTSDTTSTTTSGTTLTTTSDTTSTTMSGATSTTLTIIPTILSTFLLFLTSKELESKSRSIIGPSPTIGSPSTLSEFEPEKEISYVATTDTIQTIADNLPDVIDATVPHFDFTNNVSKATTTTTNAPIDSHVIFHNIDKDTSRPIETKSTHHLESKDDYPARLVYPPIDPGMQNPKKVDFLYSEEDVDNDASVLRPEDDQYTFVALLDVVFTNGYKKSCTGAIVHDNIVVTAAHCFSVANNEYLQPELTMSFVVIGSKIMFDTGYEQYLPIERVVTHPSFKGWTADLALVLTFAGMTSDKPGHIIRLLNTPSTAVDTNVTVMSWGRCKDDLEDEIEVNAPPVKQVPKNNKNEYGKKKKHAVTMMYQSNEEKYSRHDEPPNSFKERARVDSAEVENNFALGNAGLTSNNGNGKSFHIDPLPRVNTRINNYSTKKRRRFFPYLQNFDARNIDAFKSWRRSTGNAQNNLTVESFSFVNVQTCSKLVERSMPPLYRLTNKNEVICFASEDHYITNEDAGAPVVQAGKLVGVTVGGTVCDGEHVAVAMKIACFCEWMSEHLPKSNSKPLQCCEECCDVRKQNSNNNIARTEESIYRNPMKRARVLIPVGGVGGEDGRDFNSPAGERQFAAEDRPAEAILAFNGRIRGGLPKSDQRGNLQLIQGLTMM